MSAPAAAGDDQKLDRRARSATQPGIECRMGLAAQMVVVDRQDAVAGDKARRRRRAAGIEARDRHGAAAYTKIETGAGGNRFAFRVARSDVARIGIEMVEQLVEETGDD